MSGAKRSADDAESVVTPANFTAVVGGDEKRARPSIDTQIEDELPSDERDWGDEAVEAALAFDIDESSEVQGIFIHQYGVHLKLNRYQTLCILFLFSSRKAQFTPRSFDSEYIREQAQTQLCI